MSPQSDPHTDRSHGRSASNERSFAQIVAAGNLDLDVDTLFDVLSSPRRRYLLARLQQRGEPMSVADLATDVGAWELNCDCSDIPEKGVEALHVSLYHVHVPKMVEAGLVAYDREHGTVSATDAARELIELEHLPSL